MASNEVIYKTRVVFRMKNITKDTQKVLASDDITVGSDVWRVFASVDARFEDVVVLGLELVKTSDDNESSVEPKIKYFIMNSEDKPSVAYKLERQTIFAPKKIWSNVSDPLSQMFDQKDKYLLNNALTVVYDITVFKPTTGPKRRRHFGNSFLNKDLNDCRFLVCGEELLGSKAILSGQSDVFERMFTTDMEEKKKSEVIIDDIDPEVFREFLHFMHFGDSDKLYSMAERLLYVSDKYMVSELKTICENIFYLRIQPKNAFKVLEVLSKYGNQDLIAKCMQYIKCNLIECLDEEWPKLVGNDNQTITNLVKVLKNNSNTTNDNKSQTMSYTYMSGL